MGSILAGLLVGSVLTGWYMAHITTKAGSPRALLYLKLEQCEAELPRDKHCILVAVEESK